MNRNDQVKVTEEFVKQNLKGYDSGHDWWHIMRVRKLAAFINDAEKLADPFVVDISSLLHDTADSKFADGNTAKGYEMISEFMDKVELAEIKDQVMDVIMHISFSSRKAQGKYNSPLLRVIQDADRIDAMGAIGIARAFNYGGFRNNPIYIPNEKPHGNSKSTIGHFYDKLLKLRDLMNTSTGRSIAAERHLVLERFLEQFYSEWHFPGELS